MPGSKPVAAVSEAAETRRVKNFDPVWGADKAARYGDGLRGDEAETVDLLAELVGDGVALELAIGSGRVALPLADRGVEVDGIELSSAMIGALRAKPGGDALSVVEGDMAEAITGRRYRLVYLIFNTLFNLLTQDDQVRCFGNAARHLDPDGCFLVEAGVPSAWTERTSYVDAEAVEGDRVLLDVCRYDPVTQILEENHVTLTSAGAEFGPIAQRLAWPAELDLMARMAGLELQHRWGGWHRAPFTADSVRHVSVYGPRR
jgi:SAM-dependent methyltransferase